MSKWERRFLDHAVWPKLDALREKIDGLETPKDDDAKHDTLNHMAAAVDFALARRDGTPMILVTQNMLDSASNAVDQMSNYADYWKQGQYSDGQMDQTTDGLLQALASWPPMSPEQTTRALNAAARHITASTEEILDAVGKQRDHLTQTMSQLEEDAANFKRVVAQQQTAMDAAITTFQTESSEAIEGAAGEWKDERTAQAKQSGETIETLKQLEAEARELVHAATGSIVATDYGTYARNKTIAAWVCDVVAAVIGMVGVGAIIYHLYSADTGADGDVGLSLTRLAASLGTLGIAALVAHRGNDHHREARAAKRTDLALRRVGPFTSNLSADIRERIVVETTDRIFVRGELDERGAAADAPSVPSLWDRIQESRNQEDGAG